MMSLNLHRLASAAIFLVAPLALTYASSSGAEDSTAPKGRLGAF